jgi:fucose permease
VPPLFFACLTYLGVALPASTLGLLWPEMRVTFHEPIGALGALLAFGTTASVISSAATGRLLDRFNEGPVLAVGTLLVALALALEAVAFSLWVFAGGTVMFGIGFGAIDSALNAYAAHRFGARQINWMHASYGVGACVGPLLVTIMLSNGLGWRWTFGTFAAVLVAVACVLAASRSAWEYGPLPLPLPLPPPPLPVPDGPSTEGHGQVGHTKASLVAVVSSLTFTAVETGIESGAGIWAYVFLTSGRGLSHEAAGVAVAGYWAMMVVGRAVLGPVAERVRPALVLGGAVTGVAVGAALMALPGSGAVAVAGIMTLGLAAAPVFPLLTLTTMQRVGGTGTATRTVSLQVAASAVGGAAVPAAMGLAIGALGATSVGPVLLVLAVAMCSLYGYMSRLTAG